MKLLDILFEGRSPKFNSLNDVENIISKYDSFNVFTNSEDYFNVRNFLKREFGDNSKLKYDELTKKLKDNDINKNFELKKSELKYFFKDNPEWNFDKIILGLDKHNNTTISGMYCSKHKTYKNNVVLNGLIKGHTYPCSQCGKEIRSKKTQDTLNTKLLKGDKNIEKYKNSYSEKKYDDDYLISIAQKYMGKNINIFRQEKPLEYLAILDKGPEFFNDIFSNFLFTPYPNDYLNAVKKYYKNKSYTEFSEKNRNVYYQMIKKGPYVTDPNTGEKINTYEFLREFTKDMVRTGNLSKRMIYAHEFYDGKKPVAVYVGLTWNEDLRYSQHVIGKFGEKKRTTPVTKFMKENPKLIHVYKPLTDYVDEIEALKLEDEWERKYKLDGWVILNIKRIFSLGTKSTGKLVSTVDDLRDSINSFVKRGLNWGEIKLKYPVIVNTIYRNKLQNKPHELFKNVVGYEQRKTLDEIINAAMKYDSVSELRNRNIHLYNSCIKRMGGVEQLYKMYEDKRNNKMK
jgi:hypothetical protein